MTKICECTSLLIVKTVTEKSNFHFIWPTQNADLFKVYKVTVTKEYFRSSENCNRYTTHIHINLKPYMEDYFSLNKY